MNEWPHQLMTLLTPLFELCILGLNVFSIIVLVWGVCLAGKDFIKSERQNQSRFTLTKMNTFIKNFLGSYILLSLEILIAADIIESIVKPTFQDILKLATLVIIRTVISYFLHKEIEDTMTDMEQQEKEPDTQKISGYAGSFLFNRFKIMKWFVRQTLHFTFFIFNNC